MVDTYFQKSWLKATFLIFLFLQVLSGFQSRIGSEAGFFLFLIVRGAQAHLHILTI